MADYVVVANRLLFYV